LLLVAAVGKLRAEPLSGGLAGSGGKGGGFDVEPGGSGLRSNPTGFSRDGPLPGVHSSRHEVEYVDGADGADSTSAVVGLEDIELAADERKPFSALIECELPPPCSLDRDREDFAELRYDLGRSSGASAALFSSVSPVSLMPEKLCGLAGDVSGKAVPPLIGVACFKLGKGGSKLSASTAITGSSSVSSKSSIGTGSLPAHQLGSSDAGAQAAEPGVGGAQDAGGGGKMPLSLISSSRSLRLCAALSTIVADRESTAASGGTRSTNRGFSRRDRSLSLQGNRSPVLPSRIASSPEDTDDIAGSAVEAAARRELVEATSGCASALI